MTGDFGVRINGAWFRVEEDGDERRNYYRWRGEQIPTCPRCDEPLLEAGTNQRASVTRINRDEQVVCCDGCGWTSAPLERV